MQSLSSYPWRRRNYPSDNKGAVSHSQSGCSVAAMHEVPSAKHAKWFRRFATRFDRGAIAGTKNVVDHIESKQVGRSNHRVQPMPSRASRLWGKSAKHYVRAMPNMPQSAVSIVLARPSRISKLSASKASKYRVRPWTAQRSPFPKERHHVRLSNLPPQ